MNSTNRREDIKRDFQQALLTWAKSKLRDYPWRRTKNSAYKILVAELLLKRTTATAAARAYNPFIRKFPTVNHLFHATKDELAGTLEPIGLSKQRAHAIKELAQVLIQRYEGQVPTTLEKLYDLPGIGDYAARAIMSFSHDTPLAVVDGNVERVLRRVFQDQLVKIPNRATIQNIVDDLLPENGHRNFNFALLDLGSLICRPTRPSCYKCPLQRWCDYARIPQDTRLSGRLRGLRQARQLSLLELAKKAGVTKLTIINMEAGRTYPRKETLRKIARVLDLSIEDIAERL
ncbi:Endonuclease III [subsurface metagenome]